jgi:ATP-dependent HslUV protease, peptidase subunit HslV
VANVPAVQSNTPDNVWRSTTVLAVRRGAEIVVVGDGQVTVGNMILKHGARKVRRLGDGGSIVAGFAGASADAITLFERLENQLKSHAGSLTRAAVELAKEWRADKVLRRLDAMMLAADGRRMFLLSGTGDVMEPDGDCAAIGSGGGYAVAAARALLECTELPARAVAEKAMALTADLCVFTNRNFVFESVTAPP